MKRFTFLLLMAITFSLGTSKAFSQSITLNKGEKWQVDNSTREHVQKMQKLGEDYSSSKDKDPVKLKASLQEQLNQLVRSCRMKGEAHDALHEWLHPFMQLVKEMDTAKSPEAPEIQKVLDHLKAFNNYFE